MAYPSPEGSGVMAMVETKHPLLAAGLATAVRRARRTFVLGRGWSVASSLGFASAGAMGIVGLSPLTEPPANDALTVRRLAFGAVARVAARPSVVSSPPGGDGGGARGKGNPGRNQSAGVGSRGFTRGTIFHSGHDLSLGTRMFTRDKSLL